MSVWVECKECHRKTRLLVGRDSRGHDILVPCEPCAREEKARKEASAIFAGLCDECDGKILLVERKGIMTCPKCKTEYRNLERTSKS